MAAFSVISAIYTNLAISRDVHPRCRDPQAYPWDPAARRHLPVGRVIHAMLVSILLVVITPRSAWLFYEAHVPTGVRPGPEHMVTVIVGAMAFSALGSRDHRDDSQRGGGSARS